MRVGALDTPRRRGARELGGDVERTITAKIAVFASIQVAREGDPAPARACHDRGLRELKPVTRSLERDSFAQHDGPKRPKTIIS